MAIFAGRVKNVPLDGRTAVNRSFMTGTNMAGIPQNIMGREYVRPDGMSVQIIHSALNIRRADVTEQADGRIPHSGHDTWVVLRAHLGAVFIIDHIANPVETSLNAQCARTRSPIVTA